VDVQSILLDALGLFIALAAGGAVFVAVPLWFLFRPFFDNRPGWAIFTLMAYLSVVTSLLIHAVLYFKGQGN
jgi:hypothetical protein